MDGLCYMRYRYHQAVAYSTKGVISVASREFGAYTPPSTYTKSQCGNVMYNLIS